MESHKLALRVERLEAFLRFLSAAQTEIRYSASPVEQIVRKHGGDFDFLSACADYCSSGETFTGAWTKAVKTTAVNEGFIEKDLTLLQGFGAEFGASDTDGQISHCRLYSDLVTANLKTAKEEQSRKSKLYLMLGIFAGISASLLLC